MANEPKLIQADTIFIHHWMMTAFFWPCKRSDMDSYNKSDYGCDVDTVEERANDNKRNTDTEQCKWSR